MLALKVLALLYFARFLWDLFGQLLYLRTPRGREIGRMMGITMLDVAMVALFWPWFRVPKEFKEPDGT